MERYIKLGLSLFGLDDDVDLDSESYNDTDNYDCDDDEEYDCNESNEVTDNSNVSFGHAPNDGTYLNTGKDVNIQCSTGTNKGTFDVFLHNGVKYIDFQNQWIKIDGKQSFFLNGNTYYIK